MSWTGRGSPTQLQGNHEQTLVASITIGRREHSQVPTSVVDKFPRNLVELGVPIVIPDKHEALVHPLQPIDGMVILQVVEETAHA